METKLNYIGGKWVPAVSGKTREVLNPATGEVLALAADSGREDAKRAIAAAKDAFYGTGEWRRTNSQKKADTVWDIAVEMEKRKDRLAMLDTLNNGKPLREAEGDVDDAIHCFKYYAGLITKPYGGAYDVNENFGPMHCYTVHEPVGVCAQITPWNYPLLMAAWKLAPALAAGNSVVFKPASLTPLSTVELFDIFDIAGLPPGTANLVTGSGSSVGAEFAESRDVDMVVFTGSTAVGRSIAAAAAGNLKKVGLELGGKSPNVIFADADLEGAVEWAMIGIFFNQGEVCSAGSRIIIEESLHDRFAQGAPGMAGGFPGGPAGPDRGNRAADHGFNVHLAFPPFTSTSRATSPRCIFIITITPTVVIRVNTTETADDKGQFRLLVSWSAITFPSI